MSKRLVQGVGINDRKYSTKREGKACREYILWSNMLKRCYSKNYLAAGPSYEGCTVSDNFKLYSYFYEWCRSQQGFYNVGWSLDKDLLSLSEKSKQYHENTCVFLPNIINSALAKGTTGELPGTTVKGRKYEAQIRTVDKVSYLGRFDTKEEASQAYQTAKVQRIKDLANQYKYQLDPRAYLALMNYSG